MAFKHKIQLKWYNQNNDNVAMKKKITLLIETIKMTMIRESEIIESIENVIFDKY